MKFKKLKMVRLWEAQGGHCWCGSEIVHPLHAESFHEPESPSLDHVIPQSERGHNRITNLLLAHRLCNNARMSAPATREMLSLQVLVLDRLETAYPGFVSQGIVVVNGILIDEPRVKKTKATDILSKEGRLRNYLAWVELNNLKEASASCLLAESR